MATLEDVAEKFEAILRVSHNPYLKIATGYILGLRWLALRDFEAAQRYLAEALALIRECTTGPEFEPELLSVLAKAQYDASEEPAGVATARLALETARKQNNRVAACRAALVLADAQDRGVHGTEFAAVTGGATCWRELADGLLDETGAQALVHT